MNEAIQEQLDRIEGYAAMGAKSVLNVEETALMLGVSKSRVYHLVSSREIPHYKQGKNVYFKKSEIEDWQLRERIPTNEEISSLAATYVATNKR